MKKYKLNLFLLCTFTIFFIGIFFPIQLKRTYAATLVNEDCEETECSYTGFICNSCNLEGLYWLDNGKIAADKEVYDPVSNSWYWFDSDGTMARNKEVFLAANEERTEGKWVYYDENGHMVKGFYSLTDGNGNQKNVFYDYITGAMQHGEYCLDNNWYRFDSITGAMVYGEYVNENGWYYYDENTGIMQKGIVKHHNNEYYYDKITGIMYHGVVARDNTICKYDRITGVFIGKADDESLNDVWTIEDIYDYIYSLNSLNRNTLDIKRNADGADIYCKTDDDLKIMQVTDIHISGISGNYRKNILAMQTVYEMTTREQPDFIVSTGDLVFGNVYSNNEEDSIAFDIVLKFMDKIGIPWTWTFGNHDHDYFDRLDTNQLTYMLSKSSTLYMAENNPNIKGYSNGVFRIYKNDNLENALILLDSHGEIWNNNQLLTYDYIDESQISWYSNKIQELKTQAGKEIDTFVYIHIPIEEYAQINPNNYLSGTKREEVACSKTPNELAETMAKLGSTRALFCGHDHVNDFIAFYNGMYFVYSKSIDYTAYIGIEKETVQRGVGVLIINQDNTFDIQNKCYR